jgi:hypothetical protein
MEVSMPKRKIVQIVVVNHTRIPPYTADDYFQHVYALCDDGSVWQHTLGAPGPVTWDRLPDIPQDGETRGFGVG